jgi:hypothetical protein
LKMKYEELDKFRNDNIKNGISKETVKARYEKLKDKDGDEDKNQIDNYVEAKI